MINKIKYLLPIYRSLAGSGTRKTLDYFERENKNFSRLKFKTNKKIFDWKIPYEWEIKDSYIQHEKTKKKYAEFKKNNLHVVSYSVGQNKKITLNNLKKKIYTDPKYKSAIPYVTSYYNRDWGICMSENQKNNLPRGNYKVKIDSFHKKGFLEMTHAIIKGKSSKEIMFSSYICHPSMANNELSGPIVSMSLINFFQKKINNKTIRFIFIPETIGSIAFIYKNLNYLKKWCIGGYNLTCIGDDRNHSCLLSKNYNSPSDKCLLDAYKNLKLKYKIYSFLKRGSDERQYNSPGIDLGITSIFRTKYGEYKEYHSSFDNFNLVTLKGIMGGYKVAQKAISNLQNSIIPQTNIFCEPMLSKRKMYSSLSIVNYKSNKFSFSKKILNFLQYSDGKNRLEDISKKINLSLNETQNIYKLLKKKKLVDN